MYFYLLRMEGTDYYKYGIARNIKNRLQQYKTHNPFNVIPIYVSEHLPASIIKRIEMELDEQDSLRRIAGRKEWLKLNATELNITLHNITTGLSRVRDITRHNLLYALRQRFQVLLKQRRDKERIVYAAERYVCF